ncbi:hypothetical protein METBIDRAFT_30879 [Metschnikowia bicuspidata var. bicuspidata NRRL YB-4993]|uniref:Uncharacterized protein n=1 Tax=Metschnikowia bicuspidata var. bicuspidata NRRL YB-4993 TaxID=869754 RepID=A0A1A0HCQ7_9ASCO|nr:hypothetical protein METBIDRAFT_30879 [Metschnikowia bicuspidata var. bicuspidata NRRL YB-4993]OBA21879.1 hypothetical protein METBIDRAFT_30879 [Metschnikowia bicuspidata var. bicuspidata NRRL YB-4993]
MRAGVALFLCWVVVLGWSFVGSVCGPGVSGSDVMIWKRGQKIGMCSDGHKSKVLWK